MDGLERKAKIEAVKELVRDLLTAEFGEPIVKARPQQRDDDPTFSAALAEARERRGEE